MKHESIIDFLKKRRSSLAKTMDPQAPSSDDLGSILEIGTRVPDHGKLCPWRLVTIQGEAREKFGRKVLMPAFLKFQRDDASEMTLKSEEQRFARAGLVIAVLYQERETKKIPAWEMQLSAGAVCAHLLIAAQALGYAGQWLTEWPCFSEDVLSALGGRPGRDRIAGFIYIGGKTTEPKERDRPNLDEVVSNWS